MPNNQAHDTRTTNPANRVVQAVGLQVAANMGSAPQGVIFSDNFDDQPDWHTGLPENDQGGLPTGEPDGSMWATTHTLPEGWTAVRQQKKWSPVSGDTDRHHVLEITSASTTENPNRVFGGTGKSLTKWRENYGTGNGEWHSDGILLKHIGERSEVYVEAMVNLSNECVASYYAGDFGKTKAIRILSHDNPTTAYASDYWTFFDVHNKPIFIFDIGGGPTYGIRNKLSFYRYNDGTSVTPMGENVTGYPTSRTIGSNGDYDGSFALGSRIGDLTDYRDGGLITDSTVDIDQVYGDETQWVKVGLYVKMNSAPGVKDGEFRQWINDEPMLHFQTMDWVHEYAPMKQWNIVALGGNDHFVDRDEALRHEEWLAFDNLIVSDSIPDHLKE